jgi:hypothetical protein
MWKWTCPRDPKLIWEHHSWKSLNESLTIHEDGFSRPGFRTIPPCNEEHDYWDDGVPCQNRRCRIRYVRDDEPVDANA